MRTILFYDNYNNGQDHEFIVGDKLYDTLLTFCIFHTKSSECKEVEIMIDKVLGSEDE